ncbi:MAG: phytanoyl-CoA dioxygenase family protein [Chloroflexota bacterium]
MAVTDAIPDMERELKFFPSETQNPKILTKQQIDQFNELGYIFPIDVFTDEEIKANRAYFDKLMGMARDANLDNYSINGWHTHCQELYDLVMNDRILDYVEDILGPNLVCTMTHYFAKDPGDVKSVYWHQDASFWGLTPSKVLTVWIAIDDVDVENGAMKVFPGTHLLGRIPFEWVTDEEDGVLNQHIHNPEQYAEPISIELKAGQISLHTDMLLHGSQPNPSNRRRCGLTIRYFPADVRGMNKNQSSGVIARGHDPEGYWQHISRPSGEQIPPSILSSE